MLFDLTLKARSCAFMLSCAAMIAACAPVPEDVVTEVDGTPIGASGLEERLPDTCNLSNYEGFVGQPLAAVTIPTDVQTRIVRSNSILSQVYEAARVNFHVNDSGTITKVICG